MQRSGTNYLVELVRRNITTNVIPGGDCSICWKHALPSESGPEYALCDVSAGRACLRRPDVSLCLIAKHPYAWVTSARRPRHDLLDRRPSIRDASGRADIAALAGLYVRFHLDWLEIFKERSRRFGTNDHLIPYENLVDNPARYLREIAAGLGVDLGREFEPHLPEVVPYSQRFSPEATESAKRGAHELTAEEIAIVDRVLGRTEFLAENFYGFVESSSP